jgi:hypothetical protein
VISKKTLLHSNSENTTQVRIKLSSGLMIFSKSLLLVCTYFNMVRRSLCPSSFCIMVTSVPLSTRWVAKLWRRLWVLPGLITPAFFLGYSFGFMFVTFLSLHKKVTKKSQGRKNDGFFLPGSFVVLWCYCELNICSVLYSFISCSLIETKFYLINPSNPCHPPTCNRGRLCSIK